jgi:hypothetical protein
MAAAAIAIVGCGGGGGKQLTGTTAGANGTATGSVSGDSVAVVNMATSAALADIYYDTGQGRFVGDITANMGTAQLINSATGAELQDPLPHNLALLLDGYTQQAQVMDQTAITNSAQYNTFVLNVPTLSVQNDTQGDYTTVNGAQIVGTNPPQFEFFIDAANGGQVLAPGTSGSFAATIGLFPGRQTAVQVFLNDGSINLDPTSGDYVFNRTVFLAANTTSSNPNLQGFLSDYIQFDISHVTNPPQVLDATGAPAGPATSVFFSGEDRRYGAGSAVNNLFTVYTPVGNLSGTFQQPSTLTSPPTGSSSPNTTVAGYYTVRDPNPTDLTGGTFITSLQGIWRPFSDLPATTGAPSGVKGVFQGLGTFEVIMMPHITDDNNQDIIIVVRDGATQSSHITNMYFGIADLSGLTFTAFPIADIQNGSDTGAIGGTLSGLLDANNSATSVPANVRSGRYAFSGTMPTGFRASGRFIEYRL